MVVIAVIFGALIGVFGAISGVLFFGMSLLAAFGFYISCGLSFGAAAVLAAYLNGPIETSRVAAEA